MQKKSSNYIIYQIHLMEAKQKSLHLQHLDGTSILEHAQEHFGSYFNGSMLDLYKKNKDGEITRHPNDILQKIDDVILLRVNNVQMKSVYLREDNPKGGIPDYKEKKFESNPYSYVIIDNRPGVCQMAIEKSSTWSGSTDAVRDLLEEWFKERLGADYNLDISIDMKWQESEFWEYVEQRFRDTGDLVTQFKFDIMNQTKVTPTVQNEQPMSGMVKAVYDSIKLMNALKASITMDTAGDHIQKEDKKYEDIMQMVRLCSQNTYQLSVTFRDYGEYKCNDLVKAMFPLDEKTFNTFLHPEPEFSETKPEGEYRLIKWLDYILKETANFNDGNKIGRKTKEKGKK